MKVKGEVLLKSGMGKTKGFFNEFKAFIAQGNILDMAVGIVIGTAFKSIISSLVADIIMPAVGVVVGDADFSDLKYVLKEAVVDAADPSVVIAPESAIRYGMFVQYIIDFLIIGFCMFVVVKLAIGFRKKLEAVTAKEAAIAAEEAAAAKAAPAEPGNDEKMLAALVEIKDLLKQQK